MGDFVAVGFLRYRWKHSENDKENNKSFCSFLIIKFECLDLIWLWEVLFKMVTDSILSRGHTNYDMQFIVVNFFLLQ